jgi:hypothetical protein
VKVNVSRVFERLYDVGSMDTFSIVISGSFFRLFYFHEGYIKGRHSLLVRERPTEASRQASFKHPLKCALVLLCN